MKLTLRTITRMLDVINEQLEEVNFTEMSSELQEARKSIIRAKNLIVDYKEEILAKK